MKTEGYYFEDLRIWIFAETQGKAQNMADRLRIRNFNYSRRLRLITVIILLLSVNIYAQLSKPVKIKTLEKSITGTSLQMLIKETDTVFTIVYKNAKYPSLNDWQEMNFHFKNDALQFLFSLHLILTTYENNTLSEYQLYNDTYTIINKSKYVVIMKDDAQIWMNKLAIESFINKLNKSNN
jgi:hypothetical protein